MINIKTNSGHYVRQVIAIAGLGLIGAGLLKSWIVGACALIALLFAFAHAVRLMLRDDSEQQLKEAIGDNHKDSTERKSPNQAL